MKLALILACVFAVAFGGITQLTVEEEAEAWALWRRRCIDRDDGFPPWDEANGINTIVFCKDGEEYEDNTRSEKVDHVINVTPGPDSPTHIIFVRPPPIVFKHNLTIKGEAGNALNTKVFVLPQNATHKYEYVDKREPGSGDQKPTLHFLTDEFPEAVPYGNKSPTPKARKSRTIML